MTKQQGFTRTPNKILDLLPEMDKGEMMLTMLLVRHTFGITKEGQHLEQVRFTFKEMMAALGVAKATVNRAVGLVEKRGIFKRGRKSIWYLSLDFSLNSEPNTSTENGSETRPKQLDQSSETRPSSIKERKDTKDNTPPTPKKRKKRKAAEMPPIPDCLNLPAFTAAWDDYQTHRREIKKPLTPLAAKKQLNQLERWGLQRAIVAIDHSIAKGWQSIYEPKEYQNGHSNGRSPSIPKPAPAEERIPGAQ